MTSCRWQWLTVLFVLAVLASASSCDAIAGEVEINRQALAPKGEYYDAFVPGTLDLAERARLAVQGLTSFLDPARHYCPYGQGFFNCNPPMMTNSKEMGSPGPPNWGKIAQAILLAREMCGSTVNLDIEEKMLKGMLTDPWIVPVSKTGPNPSGRAMLALMTLYRQAPSPAIKARIEWFAREHDVCAHHSGGMAWYCDPPEDLNEQNALGVLGYGAQAYINGVAMRVLSQWSMQSGQIGPLDMARQLKDFLMQPKYWHPEAGPRAVVGSDHGQFMGHHHSFTQGLMGLLWYAEAAHDVALMQFVREGYEYLRTFGIARIGVFGEACTTGDMTMLALKLSDLGMGDYYEDADGYVRNHLTELQITDAARLQAAVSRMPASNWSHPLDTTQNAVARCVGCYLSDSCHPAFIPAGNLWWTICCPGNCTPALYYAWESIVRCESGLVRVNLLLNRASPWIDVDSYLPYEGKVVLRNKTAHRLAVRIPLWVRKPALRAKVGDRAASFSWLGNCLLIDPVRPNDHVTIIFPVETTIEHRTLNWDPKPIRMGSRDLAMCPEATNPGKDNPAQPLHPVTYELTFRGNTLVDISPRAPGIGYALYQRMAEKSGASAPTIKVTRYVADTFKGDKATRPEF